VASPPTISPAKHPICFVRFVPLYFDPGNRKFSIFNVFIRIIVGRRYDIDGLHFDELFLPDIYRGRR